MLAEIPIHPVIVHCPIALIFLALFCELLEIVFKKEEFGIVSKWSLLFGSLGAVLALISGSFAAKLVEHSEASHLIIESHAGSGFIVVVGSIVLTIWRFLPAESLFYRFRIIYMILFIVVVIFLARTGYLGGKLVYEYGIGVKKEVISTQPEIPSTGEKHKHEHKHSP